MLVSNFTQREMLEELFMNFKGTMYVVIAVSWNSAHSRNSPLYGVYEANSITASLKSKKNQEVGSYGFRGRCLGAHRLFPQLQINENEKQVIIECEVTMQSPDLGHDVRTKSFNTKLLVPVEQRLEELDRKMEELQKGVEDGILEFAERMNVRWNKLRESLHKVSSGNLSSEA